MGHHPVLRLDSDRDTENVNVRQGWKLLTCHMCLAQNLHMFSMTTKWDLETLPHVAEISPLIAVMIFGRPTREHSFPMDQDNNVPLHQVREILPTVTPWSLVDLWSVDAFTKQAALYTTCQKQNTHTRSLRGMLWGNSSQWQGFICQNKWRNKSELKHWRNTALPPPVQRCKCTSFTLMRLSCITPHSQVSACRFSPLVAAYVSAWTAHVALAPSVLLTTCVVLKDWSSSPSLKNEKH